MKRDNLLKHWNKTQVIHDMKVIDAFLYVPREEFVPFDLKECAYDDVALPLSQGQTISQPTTVMLTLQALGLQLGDKVLEVGTGSGWNAALLAFIVKPGDVHTIETIPELYEQAKEKLKNTKNVHCHLGDGSLGLKKKAPFDKIVVTAACNPIPKPLIDQLKEGGILVAPEGPRHEQTMMKIRKKGKKLFREKLGKFAFVPLTGKHGLKN